MPDNRPNVLWYCTDQQRYDTICALGNTQIRTPVLDGLVRIGVAFTRAYAQSPICAPRRASFLTGRYPASHHVHRNGNTRFPPHERLVTRMFADAGYDCGLVGKLHLAGAQHTIERRADDGYRYYLWSHHPYPDIEGNTYAEWIRNEKGLDPVELFRGISGSYGAGLPEDLHQTTWCTEMAIRFIAQKRDGPWLLSVNTFAPHPTFHPPQRYLNLYDPKRLSWPLFRESDIQRQRAFRLLDQQTADAFNPLTWASPPDSLAPDLPKDKMATIAPLSYDARAMKACYYGEISLIDHQLGRILSAVQAAGQLEDTIVVSMSDHGELLGDHGLAFKGCRFFEGLVHVPLILSCPSRFTRGQTSAALVKLVDIAPTLLEAAGLPVPGTMQGRSLLPILTGQVDPNVHRSIVVSEFNDALSPGTVSVQGRQYEGSHGSMSFDGRHKPALYHGHDLAELFDLEEDPGEYVNLWERTDIQELKLQLLRRHVDALMATSDAGVPRTKFY